MKSLQLFTTLLAAGLTSATGSGQPCPQIFSLYVASIGYPYTNATIVQSAAATYLDTAHQGGPVVRYFRNDTTHLYATGFNISYEDTFQLPPYQQITFTGDSIAGLNRFSSDPVGSERYGNYTTGTYSVYSTGSPHNPNPPQSVVVFQADDGGTGGWFVCDAGDPNGGVWTVNMGTNGFDGEGCDRVEVREIPLPPSEYDVC